MSRKHLENVENASAKNPTWQHAAGQLAVGHANLIVDSTISDLKGLAEV
jgi:hypothetical protein